MSILLSFLCTTVKLRYNKSYIIKEILTTIDSFTRRLIFVLRKDTVLVTSDAVTVPATNSKTMLIVANRTIEDRYTYRLQSDEILHERTVPRYSGDRFGIEEDSTQLFSGLYDRDKVQYLLNRRISENNGTTTMTRHK